MRNDHHTALIAADQFLQEGFAGKIEVIVRLIQQQQIGLDDQQLRQAEQLFCPPLSAVVGSANSASPAKPIANSVARTRPS
jgi:hypothetical protein